MGVYDDIEKSLLEAIAIDKGNVQLSKRENMPALTLYSADKEHELIDELVKLRKEQNITQSQLAMMTGNKQQAISRTEKKEHSPSLKLFYSMARALGYEVKLVKL